MEAGPGGAGHSGGGPGWCFGSESEREGEEKEQGSRLEGRCCVGSNVGGLYDCLTRHSWFVHE